MQLPEISSIFLFFVKKGAPAVNSWGMTDECSLLLSHFLVCLQSFHIACNGTAAANDPGFLSLAERLIQIYSGVSDFSGYNTDNFGGRERQPPAGNIFTPRRETPGGISRAVAGKTGPVPAGEREPYGQVPAPGRQIFFSAAIFFLVVSPVRYYICRKFNSVKKMIGCK